MLLQMIRQLKGRSLLVMGTFDCLISLQGMERFEFESYFCKHDRCHGNEKQCHETEFWNEFSKLSGCNLESKYKVKAIDTE